MNQPSYTPFETIESAQKFLELLSESVVEAKRDLSADVQREFARGTSRRLDALRIALYNVEKLELHMKQGNRILNDLRMVRRLLFEERTSSGAQAVTQASARGSLPIGAEILQENRRSEKSVAA